MTAEQEQEEHSMFTSSSVIVRAKARASLRSGKKYYKGGKKKRSVPIASHDSLEFNRLVKPGLEMDLEREWVGIHDIRKSEGVYRCGRYLRHLECPK